MQILLLMIFMKCVVSKIFLIIDSLKATKRKNQQSESLYKIIYFYLYNILCHNECFSRAKENHSTILYYLSTPVRLTLSPFNQRPLNYFLPSLPYLLLPTLPIFLLYRCTPCRFCFRDGFTLPVTPNLTLSILLYSSF